MNSTKDPDLNLFYLDLLIPDTMDDVIDEWCELALYDNRMVIESQFKGQYDLETEVCTADMNNP